MKRYYIPKGQYAPSVSNRAMMNLGFYMTPENDKILTMSLPLIGMDFNRMPFSFVLPPLEESQAATPVDREDFVFMDLDGETEFDQVRSAIVTPSALKLEIAQVALPVTTGQRICLAVEPTSVSWPVFADWYTAAGAVLSFRAPASWAAS